MKHLIKKNQLTIAGGGSMNPKPPPPPSPPTVTQYPSVLAPPLMGDIASINSFSYAELIDLISDGPIEGLVNKNGKKIYEENIFEGIYLNDAPIKETSSTKSQKISISFLKKQLKDFWNDNRYTFAETNRSDNPAGKDSSTSSVDGMVQSVYRSLQFGSTSENIDDVNFSNGVKITSYHPKYSSYAFLNSLKATFDARALLEKAFDLSPVQNENVFLTEIEIPKFTIFLNKTFDPTEGGPNGEYPLKISIPNLGNYIYFSISSDSLNSFNYFEMPRSYAENSVLTAAGRKTFLKTLIESSEFYKYEVFNFKIFIWSIYSEIDGIRNVDDILDRYFNNIIVFQNDKSLYNYNLVQAEFKNGAEIQTPLKAFNKIEIENNIGKELIGPFKLLNCCIAAQGSSTRNFYHGQSRLTTLSADKNSKPGYSNCSTESSDDIRYVCAWPIEYTTKGACPYLICNLYMNYSIYDRNSASRTCQNAVPITHYVSNENVEEVYVTLSLDALYDTAHVDLAKNSTAFGTNVNKWKQTDAPPSNTPCWSRIQKTDYVVNSLKTAYFLIAGNSINDGYIVSSSPSISTLLNDMNLAVGANFYSAICSSIGLCTKVSNIGNWVTRTTYALTANSPLICWMVPTATCFIKEAILINGYVENPDAFEAKLKSRNADGQIAYPFGLNEREIICRNGMSFLTNCDSSAAATSIRSTNNYLHVAEYKYYTAPANEVRNRATVVAPLNEYINWGGIFKYWNSQTNSVSSSQPNTIDNLDTLYPNIKRYIVDPFLRYWSAQGGTTYSQKISNNDVIGNIYLIGFNKNYLNSKKLYFDNNGKFLITVLDQFLEEYAFKTSSGLTNTTSLEANNVLTADISITAGLQKVLTNFENGNLIGYSSVYSITKVCNFAANLTTYFTDEQILTNCKVNVFTCTYGSDPVTTTRQYYDSNNVFIVDPDYTQVCDNFDQIIFYQLFSNVTASINNQDLPLACWVVEKREDNVSNANYGNVVGYTDASAVKNATQNITAGTKLPAVVRIMVETGYESKEKVEYFGDKEYFKYFFDIFGMSSVQSYIDLGRKSYDFIYGEKGTFDKGGYITKTANIYFCNQKLHLIRISSSNSTINDRFYLMPSKNLFEFLDLNLINDCVNRDYADPIITIDENNFERTVGYRQAINRKTTNSKDISYYASIFDSIAELKCYDVTSKINDITNNDYQNLDLAILTTKSLFVNDGCVFARKAIKNNNAILGTGMLFLDNVSYSKSEICNNPLNYDQYVIYKPSGFAFRCYESTFDDSSIKAIAYGSGLYLAVTDDAKLATSCDGKNWVRRSSNFSITGTNHIINASGLFLAVGNSGKLSTSFNGIEWNEQLSNFNDAGIKAAVYANGVFVIAGQFGKLATSTDTTGWIERDSSFGVTEINSLAYGNGVFVAVGDYGKLAISTNATTWTQQNSSFGVTEINDVVYGCNMFIAAGNLGKLATSNSNATTWTQQNSSFGNTGIYALEYINVNDAYFAAGISGKLACSCDNGVTWCQTGHTEFLGNFNICDIFYKKYLFIGGDAPNTIVRSADLNFTEYLSIASYNYDYATFQNISVATCDEIKAYQKRDYYMSFYAEESIGGKSANPNLYNCLTNLYPNDVIVQFPAIEKNPNKSNIKIKSTCESCDIDWNFSNFIVRISKNTFTPVLAALTDFNTDLNFGAPNTYPASCFKINLRNHIAHYLNQENILPFVRSKTNNFLYCIDDNFNYSTLTIQDLIWNCEQYRSNYAYSLYNNIFSSFNPTCEIVGASKHILASPVYKVCSMNIREQSSAIVSKVDPIFFNASFWTVYDPNNETISLIFDTGVTAADYYKSFSSTTTSIINGACFDVQKIRPKTYVDLYEVSEIGSIYGPTYTKVSCSQVCGWGIPSSTGRGPTSGYRSTSYNYETYESTYASYPTMLAVDINVLLNSYTYSQCRTCGYTPEDPGWDYFYCEDLEFRRTGSYRGHYPASDFINPDSPRRNKLPPPYNNTVQFSATYSASTYNWQKDCMHMRSTAGGLSLGWSPLNIDARMVPTDWDNSAYNSEFLRGQWPTSASDNADVCLYWQFVEQQKKDNACYIAEGNTQFVNRFLSGPGERSSFRYDDSKTSCPTSFHLRFHVPTFFVGYWDYCGSINYNLRRYCGNAYYDTNEYYYTNITVPSWIWRDPPENVYWVSIESRRYYTAVGTANEEVYYTTYFCTFPASYSPPYVIDGCLHACKANSFFLGYNASAKYYVDNRNVDRYLYELKYNSCYPASNGPFPKAENCFQLCNITATSNINVFVGSPTFCDKVYIDTAWRDFSSNAKNQGGPSVPAILMTKFDPASRTRTSVPHFLWNWIDPLAYKCQAYNAQTYGKVNLYKSHIGYYPYGGPTGTVGPDGTHVATKCASLTYPVDAYLSQLTVTGQAVYIDWTIGDTSIRNAKPGYLPDIQLCASYYNPSFPYDARCFNQVGSAAKDCNYLRIITEKINNLYAGSLYFSDKNMLYFAKSLLQKRNIIRSDMKLRNYNIEPTFVNSIKTANSPIIFSYYENIPFSNFDNDQNNIYANDAGLAIQLPAPKYYLDGTPFRRYVKVTKLSYETLSPLIQKRISLAKVTEIIPQKFSYPFSSMVGMKIDSRAFSQIPIRSYDCKLKKILVPSNYFPNDEDGEDVRYVEGNGKYKIYEGDWDGTFKLSWTNNPAWILMDMLVNKRYGLGNYLSSDQIDIWELYKIARWCDGVDDNGYYYGVVDAYGGSEPRHSFNGIITEKFNVFDMINQVASIFRGHVYYMNSLITFDDDRLKPIIGEFNNSDVKDGIFNYTNLKKDDEYTAVEVAYIDEKDNYKPKIEYVEDSDGIRKRGILKKQINAFGITSKSQARRFGLHFLFQTSRENLNVTFTTDMKALLYKPGDLIGINDELFNSYKNFGKIEKIEDIDSTSFKITISPAITNDFLDTSEITLYTPIAKPKREDISPLTESYPSKLKITTKNILTKTSSNNYVNSTWDFVKSENRDLINQSYYYTGLISFNYSTTPTIVKCNLCATLKYEKNYDMYDNFAIKYGHWRLFTGDVNNLKQDIYLFDSVEDSIIKNTNEKRQYFFSIFDSGRILKYDSSDIGDLPNYTVSEFSITGNTNQPFSFQAIDYSSGKVSYSEVIENDRPSIENFKVISFDSYLSSGYSEVEISKYGWCREQPIKIKDSVYSGLGNLVTGSSFSFKIRNINQPTFKIMSITENYINEYNILGTEYNVDKFKLIEENSAIDDLNNTFNYLNAYNSKNNTSAKDYLLKAPILKSLNYYNSNGKKYLNIKWSQSDSLLGLTYEILIQTPSKQTNNFTISNLSSSYLDPITNEYEVNFDLEYANFEIGTYKVSIYSIRMSSISTMATKSISILEY